MSTKRQRMNGRCAVQCDVVCCLLLLRTGVERHGSHDDGRASLEQTEESLLLGDAHQRVDHTGVVAALSGGQGRVGLHANEGQIGRRADDRTQTTGDQTTDSLTSEQNATTSNNSKGIVRKWIELCVPRVDSERGKKKIRSRGRSGWCAVCSPAV